MKTGYSKININPVNDMNLAGFDKHRPAKGVLDNLYVKAVVFYNGHERLCLLSYDLIAIDHLLINKVRENCSVIKADNIIFSATHTHSGPMGTLDTMNKDSTIYNKYNIFGKTDYDYIDFLCNKTIEAIEHATSTMEEMQIQTLKYELKGIGSNRNNPQLRGDPEVTALVFSNKDKKGVIFNYACHPTVLNLNNNFYSADLIGAICNAFEKDFDYIMFLNGACGDISTRFNRQGSGLEELTRLSDIFYSEFINQNNNLKYTDNDILKINKTSIPMKVKKPMITDEAKRNYREKSEALERIRKSTDDRKEIRLAEAMVEGAMANLEYSMNYNGVKEHILNCNIIEIAGLKFLTYPGEIFSELTNTIKEKYNTGIIGYCDGYSMYLTDEAAFNNSYYEAMSSPYQKGEGEKFIRIISESLK